LDGILDASESQSLDPAQGRDPLQSFINRALAPHVQPREAPQLPALLAKVDEAAGKLMRAILHHGDFQALEAAWRALFLLVRGLETGAQLKIYVLDITKAELAGDSNFPAIQRVLIDQFEDSPDDDGWAVVAANFAFDRSAGDTGTLRRLGLLMSAAGAPLIAEADLAGEPESVDSDSPWGRLRRSADAPWLGLALPRFLLRLPYGSATEPLESFRFEEMPGTPAHQDYLWGNPAFACACLLGETFSRQRWQLNPGSRRELSSLPLHVYEEGGESRLRPCVELPMTPDEVEWALEQGYMPLIWMQGQDTIRLVRFQSIADPPARLAGRWE
jgi:type VI secretion system protein ImpC